MTECLAILRDQFPGWTVGYFEHFNGERLERCGVEISRKVGKGRARRDWSGSTWADVKAQLVPPEAL